MDFQNALMLFNSLYGDINGYTISSRGRNKIHQASKAFTYGEVSAEAFNDILKSVSYKKGGKFYDLGSGTGKAVILAHLLGDFSSSRGIELLDTLHEAAEGILHRFNYEIKPYLPQEKQNQKIELLEEDFLHYDFFDGDLIFTHSTCFPDEVWNKLIKKLELLKKGTIVITVTRDIHSHNFELLKSQQYGMAWGRATVWFYERV